MQNDARIQCQQFGPLRDSGNMSAFLSGNKNVYQRCGNCFKFVGSRLNSLVGQGWLLYTRNCDFKIIGNKKSSLIITMDAII